MYEIKNGNGIIKQFSDNYEIKYDGKIKNGLRNGKGKEYIYINYYQGEFSNGKKMEKLKNLRRIN